MISIPRTFHGPRDFLCLETDRVTITMTGKLIDESRPRSARAKRHSSSNYTIQTKKKGEALPLPNISQFFQEQAKWAYNKPNNDYLNHPLASKPQLNPSKRESTVISLAFFNTASTSMPILTSPIGPQSAAAAVPLHSLAGFPHTA